MFKKQNTVYLAAFLLASSVFAIFLLNPFLTSETIREEKQPVTPKSNPSVSDEKQSAQSKKETEDKTENDSNGNDGKPAYVADWFEKSGSQGPEEDSKSVNSKPAREESEKQSVVVEKPVEEPTLPDIEKPEQPAIDRMTK
ncbi:hypothetical protein [Domibacillus epiphyticus]|uniref:Uncharacterized protein n=1 Tax=Domibacillus epiphyticus TaxID=1714355 RepID=A0A1V2A5S6_9BACI|nr:hypothetical protein [Domibacillus epiphyticus]OMP66164.1 hypothetical protein BTO28_13670 [Domibacillus epiphyticus]